jgi:hypothetical protein
VKRLARIALTLGLAVIVVLVIREGAQSIAGLLKQAGWLLLLLVPLHIVPLLLDVMGWRVLIFERIRIRSIFLIAAIREAINRSLSSEGSCFDQTDGSICGHDPCHTTSSRCKD